MLSPYFQMEFCQNYGTNLEKKGTFFTQSIYFHLYRSQVFLFQNALHFGAILLVLPCQKVEVAEPRGGRFPIVVEPILHATLALVCMCTINLFNSCGYLRGRFISCSNIQNAPRLPKLNIT